MNKITVINKKKVVNTFKKLKNYQDFINDNINSHIQNNYPGQLHEMLNYIMEGGKRIRSVICLIFGDIELPHNKHDMIIDIAISIEIIHCLSLIIDDSPSMDNDDFRRGKPTFHKKYGIAKTNLMVYYLINKISTFFTKYSLTSKEINLLKTLHFNLSKLIEGQCLDININKHNIISHKNHQLDGNKYLDTKYFLKEYHTIIDLIPNELDNTKLCALINNIKLNFLKTGSLFCLSILLPSTVICENMSNELIDEMKIWANLFGIAFQYSDDILDIKQDTDNNNPNITFIIGKVVTIKFVFNIIRYLQSKLIDILRSLHIYSHNKILIINSILDKIKLRCQTNKSLYL